MARPLRKNVEQMQPTHDRIVETATRLFLDRGYAGTSMNMLAKACDIQKASLYHHFDSKEAVLFACFEQGHRQTVERMRETAGRTDIGFVARLELLLDEIYTAVVETGTGRMAPVVAETAGRIPEIARRFHDEFVDEMPQVFKDFAEDGMKAGAFDRFDLDALDQAVFGIVVNLTLCRSMFAGFPDLEERYAMQTVKAQHLTVLRKLLGLTEG